MEVNFILPYFPDIIAIFFAMGVVALLFLVYVLRLLFIIARKVNHMTTATDALTAALADLQASIAEMEKRLAAPAPIPAPSVDEEAVARAAATVAAIKAQVDGLAVPATPAA